MTTSGQLAADTADTYAEWFGALAEPTRVRLLHAVASAGREVGVGGLAEQLGISQSTCSHHLRKLADVGFVHLRRERTSTLVSVNTACCTGLPHAADAVMGMLGPRPCCPPDLPADVTVRAMQARERDPSRGSTARGSRPATPRLRDRGPRPAGTGRGVAARAPLGRRVDGRVAGWAAARAVSSRPAYSGVAETSVHVGAGFRGAGVGRALLHRLVTAADAADLWTMQAVAFPENRAAIALYRSAGFRTLGLHERIGRHRGVWRDTVQLERRRADTVHSFGLVAVPSRCVGQMSNDGCTPSHVHGSPSASPRRSPSPGCC